jgi:hypothetical protein
MGTISIGFFPFHGKVDGHGHNKIAYYEKDR